MVVLIPRALAVVFLEGEKGGRRRDVPGADSCGLRFWLACPVGGEDTICSNGLFKVLEGDRNIYMFL